MHKEWKELRSIVKKKWVSCQRISLSALLILPCAAIFTFSVNPCAIGFSGCTFIKRDFGRTRSAFLCTRPSAFLRRREHVGNRYFWHILSLYFFFLKLKIIVVI